MAQSVDLSGEFGGRFNTPRTSTKYIAIHHAAALYPQGSAIEDIRSVARYHTVNRGWPGIGYHEVLAELGGGGDPVGSFLVSKPNLQRAHIYYRNHECYGVSMLTNIDQHPNALPGDRWLSVLVDVVADKLRKYPNARIMGHRDLALPGYGTSCPGKRWHDWKGELIHEVMQAIGGEPQVWRTYVTTTKVYVRTDKRRSARVAWDGTCVLPAGFPFEGTIVKGESVAGDDRWYHLRSGDGFFHAKGTARAA